MTETIIILVLFVGVISIARHLWPVILIIIALYTMQQVSKVADNACVTKIERTP